MRFSRFFADLWNACASVPHIAFENPVMHGHAKRLIAGRGAVVPEPVFVQPWEHGHMETKATGLYLRGLPALTPTPTHDVRAEMAKLTQAERSRVHFASPGPERWKERSRTLPGIAQAMASQWVAHILSGGGSCSRAFR